MGAGVTEFYRFEAPNLRILVAGAFVFAISKQARMELSASTIHSSP